ncbi:MAG TPA: DUF1080 domain-containing protein [Pirellulales bacterium]|nr:DUF1080 domain-containing protein [Pirellulales bacterium]
MSPLRLVASLFALAAGAAMAEEAEQKLFDGHSLAGWQGDAKTFRIQDGAIVGGSLEAKIPHNEFLCSEKQYGDFELRLKFKLLGDKTNAGVQLRSKRIPNHHEMIGYQADLGEGYWGALYDESRRKKILAQPDPAAVSEVLQLEDWNEYRILCQGRRIQLWINGYQTVDYTESDSSIEQTGYLALQIHGGAPGEAWYKDITLREL